MTTNPRAVADEADLTVRRTIRIAAPIDKVWSAVTEPEHISRWFGQTALDGREAGATGTMTFVDRPVVPLRIEAIDPPRMVSYRWCNDDARERLSAEIDEEHSTVFTFTLEAAGDGTQLTVVETGFESTSDPVTNLHAHRGGWDSELDRLVDLLEGGA
jgi:uncharacterized protein YndB with AHSA1/START domain